MKKLLMYFSLLMFANSINAQHSGFFAGLNGALQLSLIFNSDDHDLGGELNYETTITQAFGLDLGYKFNPKVGVQTGIIYSQQGQKYITTGNPNANYSTDLSYIKFPILLSYHFRSNKKISFFVQAGFQLSVLTEAKSSRLNVFGIYSAAYKDVKNYYSSLPIELAMGCGVQYSFRKLCINVLIRPDLSISDIEKTQTKPGLRSPTSNFTLGLPQLGFHYFIN